MRVCAEKLATRGDSVGVLENKGEVCVKRIGRRLRLWTCKALVCV